MQPAAEQARVLGGPDDTIPTEVADLAAAVQALRAAGARFRNGVGGRRILVEDPSGHPIAPFEPLLPEARPRGGS